MASGHQICTRCVMDTTDPDIEFDQTGVCNHCRAVEERRKQYPYNLDAKAKEKELAKLVLQIKKHGKNKKYDCILGVSGGVDSTFAAYQIKKLGLNPLAIHLDNGWNTEMAVHNIEKVCKKLEIDLFTYVIDWEEFRDIQLSFLKASTPDSEIPTDFAITAISYKMAAKHRIKYIITGDNYNTESILPFAWSHGHRDWKYVKNIQRRFGSKPFKTFPRAGYFKLFYYVFVKRIKTVWLLDFIDYKKADAMKVLIDELNWQPYKGKHHESIYTKFFQAYILPEKFGFDKRKAHLSSLICAGEITREEALKELAEELYPGLQLEEDKEYAAMKLGITPGEFESIMKMPPKRFWDYPSYENSWYYKIARMVFRLLTGKRTPERSREKK
jgi:N-acetyl sugar amidotransferase